MQKTGNGSNESSIRKKTRQLNEPDRNKKEESENGEQVPETLVLIVVDIVAAMPAAGGKRYLAGPGHMSE